MLKKIAFGGVGLLLLATPLLASAQSVDVQSQIASLLAQIKQLQALIAQIQGQGSVQSNCINLSTNLTLGSSGDDVLSLQTYLIRSGVLDSQYNTGYYGFITAKAVGTMQMNLNVLSSINDPAYGIVGPRTRAALACSGSQPNPQPASNPSIGGNTTQPLVASCYGSPYAVTGGPAGGITWHVNVSGGSGSYTYQWTAPSDANVTGEGGLQSSSFMSLYNSGGTKQSSIVVNDGVTSVAASCSATLGNISFQPAATINQSSLTVSTGGKDAALATLSGSASNVSQISVSLDEADGGQKSATVAGGRWSVTLTSVYPGTHSITVMDSDMGPSYSHILTTGTLTVTTPSSPTPYITSTSAKAAGNLQVDAGGQVGIFGTNLSTVDSTQVYIGGVSAPVIWTSDSQISATVPSNLTVGQSYDLYVVNRNGTSNTVRVMVLGTVAPAPAITSITPGSATTNTAVTIYGSNLSGATGIQVYGSGGQVVASLLPSSVTATSVSFTLNGSFLGLVGPGVYQLAVSTSGGTSNSVGFTVTSPAPTINTISPSTATTNTLVTVSGTNLSSATGIQVSAQSGQVVASLVLSSVTSTSVSFTLNGSFLGLAGAGTYQLQVVTPNGTSNALSFTVTS